MTIRKLGLLALWGVMASALLVSAAMAESKARIVRLSAVEGSVQMDRGTGDGFEKAFLNMPVTEGSRLKTGDDGRAEVEFEDGSAIRIVPVSEVDFTHLALGDDGRKLSTIQLTEGTLYVNVHGQKHDEFVVNFGSESIMLSEPAHFRIDLTNSESVLAVFKGRVNVNGQSGPVEVSEKHSATFDVHSDKYELAKNYEKDPYDQWDREQSDYHDRYARSRSGVSSPYSYGFSDLNYYGSYFAVPGYGMVWQPYFLDASWNPYMDGGWVYYPGYGYMWVSAYPWGWMPYRYGNWAFVSGYGWVWQPGYWNTWYAVPRVVNPPVRTVIPQPPVRTRNTVMVGRGLVVNPPSGLPHRVVINPGSAGLGVPRGAVRNLDHIAREVNKNERAVEVRSEGRAEPPSRTSPPSMRAPDGDTRRSTGHATTGSSGVSGGNSSRGGSGPRISPPPAPPRMPSRPPAPPSRGTRPH